MLVVELQKCLILTILTKCIRIFQDEVIAMMWFRKTPYFSLFLQRFSKVLSQAHKRKWESCFSFQQKSYSCNTIKRQLSVFEFLRIILNSFELDLFWDLLEVFIQFTLVFWVPWRLTGVSGVLLSSLKFFLIFWVFF